MAVNSYKEDEQSIERSKLQTLKRLFSYLFAYKGQILLVLLIMGYGVTVSLVNPLIMEAAIDDHIAIKDWNGLYKLLGIHSCFAVSAQRSDLFFYIGNLFINRNQCVRSSA